MNIAHKVLVVEDESNVSRLIRVYLEREGYETHVAQDGHSALELFAEVEPDLVLLDLMLPGLDGWGVCRRIRDESDVPIIMLTARSDEVDRVLGLELGADDYVTKPFSPRELILRVKAVLRRTGGESLDVLEFPGLVINGAQRTAWAGGNELSLTRKEFDLLWHLAAHAGRAFDREQLLEQVWGYDYTGDGRTIDVHITRLRDKLEEAQTDGRPRKYLHTIWGIGYKFDAKETDE